MLATKYQACKAPYSRKKKAYGAVTLIHALNEAMEISLLTDRVEAVANALREAAKHPEFLAERFRKPTEGHYARRPLYVDPEERFSVLVMVWGRARERRCTVTAAVGL